MTEWYVDHIIMYTKLKTDNQTEFPIMENLFLVKADSDDEAFEKAEHLLERVNLYKRKDHYSGQLSGGERQRVAVARAMINNPQLILADEPTGNLDSRAGGMVFKLLQSICRDRSLAVLMVTHNRMLADQMDRCLTLSDGILGETA